MCLLCDLRSTPGAPAAAPAADEALAPHRWRARRGFLLAGAAAVAGAALPASAQVDVGPPSRLRSLVPAEQVEGAAVQQYGEMMGKARSQSALAGPDHPQLVRLRGIAQRLIPFAPRWNERAAGWKWEVNLIGSKQVNAFCMPGGKIAFYAGLLEQLKLSDDETAMVMGHEMAHALREHAREQMAKTTGTGAALQLGSQLFGLGQAGDYGARFLTQLAQLKFSRDDETEADLVGLELAARGGFQPQAAVSLWTKMAQVSKNQGGLSFLSTHPTGPDRIRVLQENVPKVDGLYRAARRG